MPASNPLFDPRGKRLYLTAAERGAFLASSAEAARPVRTFCHVLSYTGCRLSEALALTPGAFDYSAGVIVLETLKRRRRGVFRAVPVPAAMLDLLHATHGLKETLKRGKAAEVEARIWPWARNTAWIKVKAVMAAAQIDEGPHRTPKGLRHAYAIHALSKGVPLHMVAKWMGHAQMETTAMYANAVGEEQHAIAARMWV